MFYSKSHDFHFLAAALKMPITVLTSILIFFFRKKLKCWQILKQMILDSGATSLLEFKMSYSEETMSVLVSSYGKGVFDLVTVSVIHNYSNFLWK